MCTDTLHNVAWWAGKMPRRKRKAPANDKPELQLKRQKWMNHPHFIASSNDSDFQECSQDIPSPSVSPIKGSRTIACALTF